MAQRHEHQNDGGDCGDPVEQVHDASLRAVMTWLSTIANKCRLNNEALVRIICVQGAKLRIYVAERLRMPAPAFAVAKPTHVPLAFAGQPVAILGSIVHACGRFYKHVFALSRRFCKDLQFGAVLVDRSPQQIWHAARASRKFTLLHNPARCAAIGRIGRYRRTKQSCQPESRRNPRYSFVTLSNRVRKWLDDEDDA